ncbi:hypothetical protein U0070_013874 [Myodes glareolus]|uniref:Uncharacterized protein n=1 Tax=Myodes glareolus TaxID=447135 RepID=A0AAW0HLZ5_MYOGA
MGMANDSSSQNDCMEPPAWETQEPAPDEASWMDRNCQGEPREVLGSNSQKSPPGISTTPIQSLAFGKMKRDRWRTEIRECNGLQCLPIGLDRPCRNVPPPPPAPLRNIFNKALRSWQPLHIPKELEGRNEVFEKDGNRQGRCDVSTLSVCLQSINRAKVCRQSVLSVPLWGRNPEATEAKRTIDPIDSEAPPTLSQLCSETAA